MSKSKKIVEAMAVTEQKLGRLEKALSKILTPEQIESIATELGHVKTLHKILKAKISTMDPEFKARLDKALGIKTK